MFNWLDFPKSVREVTKGLPSYPQAEMVCEVTKESIANHGRSPLLPDRHPQRDLFVCDIVDAVPKGDMASMEYPVFTLSTKPDMNLRKYTRSENFIEISPSRHGLATVHDRDVLIYCISQCMAGVIGFCRKVFDVDCVSGVIGTLSM